MAWTDRRTADGLLDALAGIDRPLPAGAVALAVEQRVAPLLLEAPIRDRLAADERAAILAEARRAAVDHLATLGALVTATGALDAAGIPSLVVDGPALQAAWGSTARSYPDLDLVVPARELGAALDAFEAVGAEVVDRDWALLRDEGRSQIHLELGGRPLDLRWHLLNDAGLRHHTRIPMGEVFADADRVEVDGVGMTTLSTTHGLLHVALRAAASGGHRLVWLVDVAVLARRIGDWDDVVRTARRWRVALPVAAMLERSRRTIGAPIPADVVGALTNGAAEPALVRALGRWQASGRFPGGGSLGRGVARGLGPSLATTASATWRGGRAVVVGPRDPSPWWSGPDEHRHVRVAAGARADYLAGVAATDLLGHSTSLSTPIP